MHETSAPAPTDERPAPESTTTATYPSPAPAPAPATMAAPPPPGSATAHPPTQPWPGPMSAVPAHATYPGAAPYGGAAYGGVPGPIVTGPSSRPGLVIAVISLIASGIALLAAAGVGLLMFAGPALPLGPGGEGGWAPITGRLPFSPDGAQVSAGDLRDAITERMEEADWYVESMSCPHVMKVTQGAVAVCHAAMDGGDWAVIVYFEDTKGTYTLQPI